MPCVILLNTHVQLYNSGSMYGIDGNIYTQGTADFIVAMTEAVIQGLIQQAEFAFASKAALVFPCSSVAVWIYGYSYSKSGNRLFERNRCATCHILSQVAPDIKRNDDMVNKLGCCKYMCICLSVCRKLWKHFAHPHHFRFIFITNIIYQILQWTLSM